LKEKQKKQKRRLRKRHSWKQQKRQRDRESKLKLMKWRAKIEKETRDRILMEEKAKGEITSKIRAEFAEEMRKLKK
jgi:hypothetical protein